MAAPAESEIAPPTSTPLFCEVVVPAVREIAPAVPRSFRPTEREIEPPVPWVEGPVPIVTPPLFPEAPLPVEKVMPPEADPAALPPFGEAIEITPEDPTLDSPLLKLRAPPVPETPFVAAPAVTVTAPPLATADVLPP